MSGVLEVWLVYRELVARISGFGQFEERGLQVWTAHLLINNMITLNGFIYLEQTCALKSLASLCSCQQWNMCWNWRGS